MPETFRIGITCYPTLGGSGVVATELGKLLAEKGHEVHFITYSLPFRLGSFYKNIYYHEVEICDYYDFFSDQGFWLVDKTDSGNQLSFLRA